MRNLWYGVCIAVALTACAGRGNDKPAGGYLIEGQVENMHSGMIYLKQYTDRAFVLADSAEVEQGQFRFMGVALQTLAYGLTTDKDSKNPLPLFIGNEHFKVTVNEETRTLHTEGSEVNSLYSAHAEQAAAGSLDMAAFVKANPASAVGPYFIMKNLAWQLELEQLTALRAAMDSTLNNNLYVRNMDKLIAVKEGLQPGKTAPAFALPDKDGRMVSLDSFRGKYVLIDFWASWCPDCRRESPTLREAARKYKGQGLVLFGVSLDSDRDAWLKGVEKDQLAWTQVSDLKRWDSPIVATYALRWIPTTILLDPEGRILHTSLNEKELAGGLEQVFGR